MAVAALGLALIASPTPVSAAGEGPVTVPIPTSYFDFQATQVPKVIGRRTWTPVSLRVSGKAVGTVESHAVGIKTLTIDVDRHLSLNAKELPTCNPRFHSRAICKRALIGDGSATILLTSQDPAQALPIDAHLALYNGGVRAGTAQLYIEIRLPGRFHEVAYRTVRVRPVQDRVFGSRMTTALPRLINGEGSLVSFDLMIGSKLKVDGEDVPVLTAICPSGKVVIQGEAELRDGETSVAGSVRACTPGPLRGSRLLVENLFRPGQGPVRLRLKARQLQVGRNASASTPTSSPEGKWKPLPASVAPVPAR